MDTVNHFSEKGGSGRGIETGSNLNMSVSQNGSNPIGYSMTMEDVHFPESLDSFMDTLDNPSGDFFLGEVNSLTMGRVMPQHVDYHFANDLNASSSSSAALPWLESTQAQPTQQPVPEGINFTSTTQVTATSESSMLGLSSGTPSTNQFYRPITFTQVLHPSMGQSFVQGGSSLSTAKNVCNTSFDSYLESKKASVTAAKSLKGAFPASSSTSFDNQDITVSEDEEDLVKRRNDRNAREQLRSQRIADQINDLRELLKSSNVQFKPDKFSTLVTVDKYIHELQKEASVLDDQLKRLLLTISQTTEIVNNQYMPTQDNDYEPILFAPDAPLREDMKPSYSTPVSNSLITSRASPEEDSKQFIRDINYKFIFDCCPFACCITGSDGRFIDCNAEFLETTGFLQDEVLVEVDNKRSQNPISDPVEYSVTPIACCSSAVKDSDASSRPASPGTIVDVTKSAPLNKSLFNVLHRDSIEGVFCAMSSMLQFREDVDSNKVDEGDTWVSKTKLARKEAIVSIRISLVRSSNGLPRFFNCVLYPLD